ncbi:MAG: ABC transporter permease [Gemmatimonadetes bacterium]|nr:ABC transporter permease [Gemmatimonadota bacterium]
MVVTTLQAVGRSAISGVVAVGHGGQLALGAVRALRKVDIWGPLFLPQLFAVGVASVPIALFIAAFTGIVLAIQASYTFTGAVPLYFVGALVGKTIVMELGPVLTGLALAGRVGANIAAELGTMRVTEQIDALESLAYDPVAYLVVPRVLAGLIMVPVVVGLAIAMGIAAGWITSLFMLDLSTPQFVRGLRLFFLPYDVTFALIKAASFGLIVTGIGAFFGFTTRGGAAGVGVATTRAVVGASMLILVLDAFWAAALL